jgi:hypothetical protein
VRYIVDKCARKAEHKDKGRGTELSLPCITAETPPSLTQTEPHGCTTSAEYDIMCCIKDKVVRVT